jgi:hypothetical protein
MTTPPTISRFWINLSATPDPPRPDIPPTPDDPDSLLTLADIALKNKPTPENLPYLYLPGSATVDSGLLTDGANTLFPVPDGSPGNELLDFSNYPTTGQPPEIGTGDPTQLSTAKFVVWHTAFQLQYLRAHPTPVPLLIGSNSSDPLSAPIHAMMSADKKKVYILENLQKSDFAKMPTADQQLIAGTDYFKTTLSVTMNLIPSSTQVPVINPNIADPGTISIAGMAGKFVVNTSTTGTSDVSSVGLARAFVANAVAGAQALIANQTFDSVTSTTRMTKADAQLFVDELENLKTRVKAESVFSVQDIKDQIAAITTRFNNALAFGTVLPPIPPTPATAFSKDGVPPPNSYTNVISTDNNATINSGYDKMIAAEKRLLQLDNAAMQIAATGTLTNGAAATDKHLDAPALIFLFQLNANQTLQQTNVVATEMVNQQNAFLKTYGIIQQILHDTEAKFNSGKQDEKKGIFGVGDGAGIGTLGATNEQYLVISMFEDLLGKPPSQRHPIETILKLPPRPLGDFYVNGPTVNAADQTATMMLSTEWGQIETSLSDAVTLINQNNQIAMNDINSTQKQQDRHFDLANNALSKAADIIQSIGRNIA